MAATSDDIEIDLDDLDPAASKKTAKVDDEPPIEVAEPKKAPKKERINPDEGIAKLQKDLAEARAAQEAAERRAQQASIAEVKAKTEVQGTHLDLVNNAITQFTSNKDALKAKYAAAAEASDWLAAAEVQLEMATLAAELKQLEMKKAQLERAPKPAPSVIADEVELLAFEHRRGVVVDRGDVELPRRPLGLGAIEIADGDEGRVLDVAPTLQMVVCKETGPDQTASQRARHQVRSCSTSFAVA